MYTPVPSPPPPGFAPAGSYQGGGGFYSCRPDAGADPISGREEPSRPEIGPARAPANSSVFDRFYKVFRVGEPCVPSCGNETGFIRVWGRFFDRFRQNGMEILEMIQVL